VSRLVIAALLGAVLVGATGLPVCAASPVPAVGCRYVIGPPSITTTPGATMVSSSISSAGCAPTNNPSITVVCLRASSDDTAGRCASVSGAMPAYVSYPYRPGTTYTVTGTGCTASVSPSRDSCQSVGPLSVRL
jgi:hypothetical protein